MIRPATRQDGPAIWAILEPIIRAGEVFALDRDMTEADALAYWTGGGREAFVMEEEGLAVGTYYLRANQAGGGNHVANAGYATAIAAQGRGVARAMCEHSLARAKQRGFAAMQFNFVIASNTRAVKLWTALGFGPIGRLPGAFRHPSLGLVDALVMVRLL
jgi:ribosomal protein S18 acetylase RimI-like enzyme